MTREIGIRLALGATRADVQRLIVSSGARLVAVGIVVGTLSAFALQRGVGSLLYGVGAIDGSAVGAILLLAAVALLACYIPSLRATRVDPLHALRYE